MITYRIGTLAEHIIAVKIHRGGTITPIFRKRRSDGVVDDAADGQCGPAERVTQVDFVACVAKGSAGVLEIIPPNRRSGIARTVIPLGPERPFLDSELPPRAGANGAFSFSEAAHFEFADGTLTWRTENMSGRIELSDHCPELSIVLRLPPGNHGELRFSSPLFFHADGSARGVLSAA